MATRTKAAPETPAPTGAVSLDVTGFGPIARAKGVQLRDLTVFAGPSNTGKSYLAVLIYALHEFFSGAAGTGSNSYPRIAWYLVRPSDAYKMSAARAKKILGWLEPAARERRLSRHLREHALEAPPWLAELAVSYLKKAVLSPESLEGELTRCFGVGSIADLVAYATSADCNIDLSCLRQEPAASIDYQIRLSNDGLGVTSSLPDSFPFVHDQALLDHIELLRYRRESDGPREGEAEQARDLALYALADLARLPMASSAQAIGNRAYYLPADRGGMMHFHKSVVQSLISGASRGPVRTISATPRTTGVLADFLSDILTLPGRKDDFALLPQMNPAAAEGIALDTANAIESIILNGSVAAVRGFMDYPIFVYQPAGWKQAMPLLNSSAMVSELAPVVLYLRHLVEPGDLLIIEEPEAHLHPAMQVQLIRELASVAKQGVRIILTTHSEWILEELANLILLSKLPEEEARDFQGWQSALRKDQVGVWLFEHKKRLGGSEVREAKLDEETGLFPVKYDLVTEGVYNRFAGIRNRIEANRGG